jgi:hypothetical protein
MVLAPPQANVATPAATNPYAPYAPATEPTATPHYTPIPAPPLTTTTYPAFGPPHQSVTPAATYQTGSDRGLAAPVSYPSTGYTAAQDYSIGGKYPLSGDAAAAAAASAQQWGTPQSLPNNNAEYWPVTSQPQAANYYATSNAAAYPATTTPLPGSTSTAQRPVINPNVSYFQQMAPPQQTAPPVPQTGYDVNPPVRTATSATSNRLY